MRPRHKAAEYREMGKSYVTVLRASMRPRHKAAEYRWAKITDVVDDHTLQ